MGYSVVIVRTRKLKGRKSMLDLVAFKNFLATRPLFSFFPLFDHNWSRDSCPVPGAGTWLRKRSGRIFDWVVPRVGPKKNNVTRTIRKRVKKEMASYKNGSWQESRRELPSILFPNVEQRVHQDIFFMVTCEGSPPSSDSWQVGARLRT